MPTRWMRTAARTFAEVHVYAGTAGHSAWFSDDNGETWIHPNSHSGMYLEQRVWSLASHPATPDRLFAGSDSGMFRWDEADGAMGASAVADARCLGGRGRPRRPRCADRRYATGGFLSLRRCRQDLEARHAARA